MASQELINIIIKAVDEASATAEKVDNSFRKIGESSSRLSRIPGFDAMRNKLSSIATTLDGKLGGAITKATNHFNNLKTRVTGVASNIRNKMSSALDGVRAKLSALNNGTKGMASSMNFLKGAVSMTAGMIGYDLFNSIMETTRASLNARSSMQAFADRLNMSAGEVKEYQKSLDDLQNSFKKIDMDVVGQQATDMAYRLGLPKESLTQLTETTAIFTDAMQRNGRSAEDSMLAMSDAMDGQFVRLKEIGIGQDDLMKNGWDGDINNKTGLLEAMNKSLKEQHYDDLAKSVDTLDDAWKVLSITMGNLLEAVLVPLTPVIVGLINGVMDFFNLIKSNPLAQGVAVIGGLTVGFALLAGAISVAMAAEGGLMALMPGFITSLYGAASGFMAISVAGAPLWAIVAAVAAVAFAVYEVGIAFGWWTDIGSMLEAISAGVQRLWSAFINNPDVQATITMVSEAVSVLWSWIQQAGQAILDFFGISNSGEFDIVRALIDAVGMAFNTLKTILQPVITLVMGVINAFNQFRTGQIDLPTFIMNIMTLLFQAYQTVFGMVVSFVVSVGARLVSAIRSAASRMVTGMISYLSQLPGRVYSFLLQVASRIASAGAMWGRKALQAAKEIVTNAVNTLTGLPGQIASALSGVVSAITSPFTNAYNTVVGIVDNIKSKVQEGMEWIGNLGSGDAAGFEAAGFEAAGFETTTSNNTTEHHETIDVNYNISLDLNNVPGGMNTTDLINALTNRDVLTALTGNRDFQTLDAKVKARINAKSNRARGA